jgi:hypothetical protein
MSMNGAALDEEFVEKAKAAGGEDMVEVGDTGLRHQNGVLYEEHRQALQGDRATQVWKEMSEEDSTIGAALLAIDNLVRRVPWDFEPAPDSGKEGERWADLCQSALGDMSMSWPDTVSSIFSMVPYGWSYHNVVTKHRNGEQPYRPDDPDAPASSDYEDGLIGWRVISPRSQDSKLRWELDSRGNVRGMWQQPIVGPAVLIPIERSALFRTSVKKNSPEGISALRTAHWAYFALRRIEISEGIGVERDLCGIPVGGAPNEYLKSNAKPEHKAAVAGMKKALMNIRNNENAALIWPTEYDNDHNEKFPLKLMTSGGRRQFDVSAIIQRKRAEMAGCLLADWLTLGHEANGSRAVAMPKMDLFQTCLGTWTQSVANIWDAHLTPRLMRANGVARKLSPKLRPGKVDQVDIEQFAQAWSALVNSGAITNTAETERWTRQQVGAPPIEDDEWTTAQSGLLVPA